MYEYLTQNRYLLDTAILLLWLEHKEQLHETIYGILNDKENTIYVSHASIWEIDMKKGLGEIRLDNLDIDTIIKASEFKQLELSARTLEIAKKAPLQYTNPFNRTIIVQAIVEELTLIALDKSILEYKQINALHLHI
jgi:PIN domain nuclease of toxin-antitoxin system